MSRRNVSGLVSLLIGVTSCSKAEPRPDDKSSTTPPASMPSLAAPASSGASTPVAAAAVTLPLATPGAPASHEWQSVSEATVKGSTALNCETKVLKGYLRVLCGDNKLGGKTKAVQLLSGDVKQSVATRDGEKLLLLHPYAPGTSLRAEFEWQSSRHQLSVEWPVGASAPKIVGTFENAPSPLASGVELALPFTEVAPKDAPSSGVGKVERAIEFSDKNGRNVVSFTAAGSFSGGSASRQLQITAITIEGGAVTELWKVNDGVKDCDFAGEARVPHASVAVTDVDKDGVAEVAFAMLLGCRNEPSPLTLKVFVVESGTKYVIRGTNRVPITDDGTFEGGDKRPDAKVATAPAPIRNYLDQQWQRWVNQQ
jgi:hypothetical protein